MNRQETAIKYAKWLGYENELSRKQLLRLSSLIGYYLGNSGSNNPNDKWLKDKAWEILKEQE